MPLVGADHLAEVLGLQFLAFVCNTSESELRAHLAGEQSLSDPQVESLTSALAVAAESVQVGRQLGGTERLSLFPLIQFNGEYGTTVAVELRRRAGGVIPDVDEPDELAQLAGDLFPTLLLASDKMLSFRLPYFIEDTHWLSIAINHHPALQRFQESIREDDELMRLFPEETPESGLHGFVSLNVGQGHGVQLEMLASDLLVAAYQTLRMRDGLAHEPFVQETLSNRTALRQLIRGEAIEVRARVAFVGIEIQDGTTFTLPWGTLRAPRPGERAAIEGGPTPRTQEAVLETTFPLRVVLGQLAEDDGGEQWREEVSKAHTELSSRAQLAALTLLLGLDRQPLVAVARTWTLIDNPAGQHPHLSWTRDPRPLHPHVLAAADEVALTHWAGLVDRSHHRSIEVACQRTLSALSLRDDPSDGLIDAAIALENLFGAKGGELRFRISTACAYLLEPNDPTRRGELQREIKLLYDQRSQIVHGEAPPSMATAEERRQRAVELVVLSLRALFERRPELIADHERATKLALQLP